MLGSIVRKSTQKAADMPIQQTKKQDDLERRLKLLRSQVYGKGFAVSENKTAQSPVAFVQDTSYLYKDLLKILILASFAIGSQIILFVLVKANLISLSFNF